MIDRDENAAINIENEGYAQVCVSFLNGFFNIYIKTIYEDER